MLTYLLAVLAACANAAASVLQRKANRELPSGHGPGPGLILVLLRRPVWCLGVLAVIAGFLLQATALAHGDLSVVEPILVFELPLTLLTASWVFGARLRSREWVPAIAMTAGLAALLYALDPSPGDALTVPWYEWVLAVGVNLLVVAVLVRWGRTGRTRDGTAGGSRSAAAYGVAAGAQFGLTAALMKGAMSRSDQGVGAVVTSWQLYVMVGTGLIGMMLLQAALHSGNLLAAQPGLTLTDPLVSVLWGVLVFHEQVRGGWYLLVALAGGAAVVTAVLVLGRSPLLEQETPDASGTPRSPGGARDAGARR
ncbi:MULTISPECIES: DMT family transporter [Streptomycetaceae]|uniref:Integral membrane protein n=1 Tax=Streptantibioticus cattleyicolor (strain ATCC 35852 / DSM 46488 / JCM 4925 / NBRC 14057 / NRRL 8057) TaxID=1003195 RepID=F8K0J4_STREN|nr:MULTISPECIES: DMT family transporter [Streptomycetaceae]AEW97397.1 hypothetical protein SCATT_50260 [Streptantibioticus cattleyicolor NRRL 8057 = DSM 46488]MYS61844.1 hypothetical protein [Streptomyces sp. SID5468]CCB77722.1 conserved membrane protein of unknown function [Streptantibioticus cattleyicolor NRRL 8057 = DSM 46488]